MSLENINNLNVYCNKRKFPLGTILCILITSLIIVVAFHLKKNVSDQHSEFTFITYFAIISFMWICMSWYIITKNFFSMYMIFMILSIPFYLGQPIVLLMRPDLISSILIARYPYSILNQTILYVMISYMFIHIGALAYMLRVPKTNIKKTNVDYSNAMNEIGIILIIISIVPTIIILINSFRAVAIYGYIGLFIMSNTIANCQGIFGVIGGFWVPGLYILIIANSSIPIKRNKYIILLILYILLIFVLGRRGENTIQIIGLLFIWHTCIKPISGKAVAKLFIFGIIFLVFISVISTIRVSLNSGNFFALFLKTFDGSSDNNFLIDILKEFGTTLIVPATVINYTPSVLPYYGGKSIINFFLMLIPNLFWDINPGLIDGTIESIFTPFLSDQSIGGFGSSFIAEMYYNFGNWGLLIFPIMGIVICKLSVGINKMENKLKLFSSIYMFNIFLWYLRGEIMTSGKNMVYYILFPVILVMGIRRLSKRE